MQNTSSRSDDRSRARARPLTVVVSRPVSTNFISKFSSGLTPGATAVVGVGRRFGPLVWTLALSVGLLSGCAKKSSESSAPEAPGMDWGGESSVEELERRLGAEESQLRAAGVALPSASGTAALADAAPNDHSFDAEAGDASAPDMAPEAEAAESVAEVGSSSGRGTSADRRRCTNVCDLSRSICDLEAQICSLAERHVDDRRYSDVCERASGDCRVAQEACNACT